MSNMRNRIRERINEMRGLFDRTWNRAVDSILDDWDSGRDNEFVFPIIDGPPGTGKTSAGTVGIAERILENPDEQIIYLCPTHFAADVALRKLRRDLNLVGQAYRLTPNPRETDWNQGIVGHPPESLSDREMRVLQRANVLICTLHGSIRAFKIRGMDVGARIARRAYIIVDEFSQVMPPLWFHSLYLARREGLEPRGFSMLGDPYQLPTVTTQPRLYENAGEFVVNESGCNTHRLRVQYRMHRDICEAINQLRRALRCTFMLESAERVRDLDLTGRGFEWDRNRCSPELREILDPSHPLVIVDTSNLGGQRRCFGGSVMNMDEAMLATKIVREFCRCYRRNGRRINHSDLAVLSPYSGQVGYIQQLLRRGQLENTTTVTIYRSQGREWPCVILSLVWNDPRGFIGFLADPRLRAQLYVGCSRAQSKLIVLMSYECFHRYEDFRNLWETDTAYHIEARQEWVR